MRMRLVVDGDWTKLFHGDAADYAGPEPDLVMTNPYGPIPRSLCDKPMFVSHDVTKRDRLELMLGVELKEIGQWNLDAPGKPQAVWVANMRPRQVDLGDLSAEIFGEGFGWWPLDLPLRLLEAYGWNCNDTDGCTPIPTVLDPFMGRGTVGRACQLFGLGFVGVDIDSDRVQTARRYLGC